jgi:DMSO/TMAO reductase YedYZ molybdopterin-dependent catalytic subunit
MVTRGFTRFWELRGYHRYGAPWREQRYTND